MLKGIPGFNMLKISCNTSLKINVHNLIHIVDDTRRLECTLDEIPCFQFENYFHFLKKG